MTDIREKRKSAVASHATVAFLAVGLTFILPHILVVLGLLAAVVYGIKSIFGG
jgi:hypothetical protein